MEIEKTLRKLARSIFYQNLYKAAKEIGTIQLFENTNNFSGIQNLFIFWLNIYDVLYTELSQKEWKYLDENVIDDDCRCDAFLYWRGQIREQEIFKNKQKEKESKLNFKNKGDISTFNVDFQ